MARAQKCLAGNVTPSIIAHQHRRKLHRRASGMPSHGARIVVAILSADARRYLGQPCRRRKLLECHIERELITLSIIDTPIGAGVAASSAKPISRLMWLPRTSLPRPWPANLALLIAGAAPLYPRSSSQDRLAKYRRHGMHALSSCWSPESPQKYLDDYFQQEPR